MPTTKIQLQQIEDGQTLKQVIHWFKITHMKFPKQSSSLRALRLRTRQAAQRAGIRPRDVSRLIAEVRARRVKSS